MRIAVAQWPLGLRLAFLALLAWIPYLAFLHLPFISDDYGQIYLSRNYASMSGWASLAADPLYRCRATSLFFTHWIDLAFGASPLSHALGGLVLHTLCTWMVYALGTLSFIGWEMSFIAACAFAVLEGHQEAVVWIAAQHEPLVFLFAIAAILLFYRALVCPAARGLAVAGVVAAYLLTLFSKESGVIVLPALAALWLWRRRRPAWLGLLLLILAIFTAWYILAIFQTSAPHQHLKDGTFEWNSPFISTVTRSVGRLLWFWGLLAGALVLSAGSREQKITGAVSLGWMALALLPYSFLAYMPRVPSRHTYLASAGLAVLLAAGFGSMRDWAGPQRARWVSALSLIFLVHNVAYLYWKKLPQFEQRAAATEKFLNYARTSKGPLRVSCAPFPLIVYQHVAAVVLHQPPDSVQFVAPGGSDSAGAFCDEDLP
ncbi:MAG: hypothetical protein HY821_20420 [Acidobacteria bacterium]|nr:hypothetical protein [Acidobacteriota bacterium]